MSHHDITLTVNGTDHDLTVEARALLAHVLRDELGYTGTNVGCESSRCGACTVAVDDCGVRINPTLVEGQVHGGVAQGVGQALHEHAVYDEQGSLTTASFGEYAVPTAGDLPDIETEATETPSPTNPLGAKGIGEAGTIAAPPAVVNAVVDALAPVGVDHLDMPLTAERVWRAIHGE